MALARGWPREPEPLNKCHPPSGKGAAWAWTRPLGERATPLKAKVSGPHRASVRNPTRPPGTPRPGPGAITLRSLPTPPPLISSTCPEGGVFLGTPGSPAHPSPFLTLLGVGNSSWDRNTAWVLGGMHKKGTKEPVFLTPRHGKNSASVCVPNTGEKALRAGFCLAFRRSLRKKLN